MLHEEAVFQLEHPVMNYLPAFKDTKVLTGDGQLVDQNRPMDVRDVLTHTSGLTYDFMADNPVAALYREVGLMHEATRTLAEIMDVLAELPLAFQPASGGITASGSTWPPASSRSCPDQPLGDFLRDRIFEPLGMTDTGFGVADDQLHRLSAMYGLPDLVWQGLHRG